MLKQDTSSVDSLIGGASPIDSRSSSALHNAKNLSRDSGLDDADDLIDVYDN